MAKCAVFGVQYSNFLHMGFHIDCLLLDRFVALPLLTSLERLIMRGGLGWLHFVRGRRCVTLIMLITRIRKLCIPRM